MINVLDEIIESIVKMDEDKIEISVNKALEENISIEDIYLNGLNEGMKKVVDLYEEGKYYVPETIVCSDTLYRGIDILKEKSKIKFKPKGKVLIAVVEGDTHDIGKSIVAIMLEAAGYEIIDLGNNVNLDEIVDKSIKNKVDIIVLSSMMTTTMRGMKTVIEKLENINTDKKPFVIIGGAPVTEKYSKIINADGYSENAPEAVKLVNRLLAI